VRTQGPYFRSSHNLSAASTPDTAQKLTHWPGCVALPARYKPAHRDAMSETSGFMKRRSCRVHAVAI
jgi:hypothetical protein